MRAAFDSLSSRRIVLFGGKGGVGKTTIASLAALHFARSRRVVLFTTDPASNLSDLFTTNDQRRTTNLTIEQLDTDQLYGRFLGVNIEKFLEIGDRGTYFDRDELRRFFELSLPGADELMAWMRIGELAEENPEAVVVVDTAPTGHALRMFGAAEHFRQFGAALDAMEEKHRSMVRQFTRRNVHDAVDEFIDDFETAARRRREMLRDAGQAAFVPVVLAEPWVVEQTLRLIAEIGAEGIDVPFAILNRAVGDPDCGLCEKRQADEELARERVAPVRLVEAWRACFPLSDVKALEQYLGALPSPGASRHPLPQAGEGTPARPFPAEPSPPRCGGEGGRRPDEGALSIPQTSKLLFLAGKGGVGKTTCAASMALQLARAKPEARFTIISVDPAHGLRDVFAAEEPPPNLSVELIDTRAKWKRFRETLGGEIGKAIDALTPRGLTIAYDTEALQKLIEVAPPGADELFAINRLAELAVDETQERIIVDTAPTGHFLRLMDLPATAGEWVREFMRILLRYRELIPAGSLGEELVSASRALTELSETLHSDRAAVFVVTRPERVVVAETRRLIDNLRERRIAAAGVIVNYVTPATECPCDQSMREHESAVLRQLQHDAVIVSRRDAPVTSLAELARLFDIASDSRSV